VRGPAPALGVPEVGLRGIREESRDTLSPAAVIARRLSYHVETYHVLPLTHIGRRKHRSSEHALHAVTAKIYEQWNNGKDRQVASLLLLDVSGAFDNVSHKWLLHNLQKQKVDENTVH
jgi:hypothetical protein